MHELQHGDERDHLDDRRGRQRPAARERLDGVGLAHVLESMVERELRDKLLVRVLADFCPPFPGHSLYYPSRTHVTPKRRALVDVVRIDGRRSRRAAER